MKKIIPISKLRVGQKFRFIPDDWFGPAKLIKKVNTGDYSSNRYAYYDIRFDARVVNSPGTMYSVKGDTKIKLISEKEWQKRWEK